MERLSISKTAGSSDAPMPKWTTRTIYWLVLLGISLLLLSPVSDTDVWWLLNSGLWMLDNHNVLDRELWSFTHKEAYWINFTWGFQLLLASAYRLGNDYGLLILKGILVATLVATSAGLARQRQDRLLPFLSAGLLVLPHIAPHLTLRPFLLEGIYLIALLWLNLGKLTGQRLIGTILLLIIWSNSHASAIVGAAAFAAYLLFDRRAFYLLPQIRHRVIATALVSGIPFMSPFGLDTWHVLSSHESSAVAGSYIEEWIKPDDFALILFLGFAAYLGLLLTDSKKLLVSEFVLLLFFAYFYSRSIRFQYEFALLLLRPLTTLTNYLYAPLYRSGSKVPQLFLTSLICGYFYLYHLPKSGSLLNAWEPQRYPVDQSKLPHTSVAVLKHVIEKSGPLHVLNAYRFGGYLPFVTKGSVSVSIDGRTPTIYGDRTMMVMAMAKDGNRKIIERLSLEYQVQAYMPLRQPGRLPIAPTDPEWQLVAFDDVSLLYLRRKWVASLSLDLPNILFDPSQLSTEQVGNDLSSHIDALERLLELDSTNWNAWLQLGVFQIGKGEMFYNTGLYNLRRALSLRPGNAIVTIYLGRLLLQSRADPKTIGALIQNMRLSDDDTQSKDRLIDIAKLLLDIGQPDMSLKYLYPDNWQARQMLDSSFDAWILRGHAHLLIRQTSKARESLIMASYLIDNHRADQATILKSLESALQ